MEIHLYHPLVCLSSTVGVERIAFKKDIEAEQEAKCPSLKTLNAGRERQRKEVIVLQQANNNFEADSTNALRLRPLSKSNICSEEGGRLCRGKKPRIKKTMAVVAAVQ